LREWVFFSRNLSIYPTPTYDFQFSDRQNYGVTHLFGPACFSTSYETHSFFYILHKIYKISTKNYNSLPSNPTRVETLFQPYVFICSSFMVSRLASGLITKMEIFFSRMVFRYFLTIISRE